VERNRANDYFVKGGGGLKRAERREKKNSDGASAKLWRGKRWWDSKREWANGSAKKRRRMRANVEALLKKGCQNLSKTQSDKSTGDRIQAR